METEKIEVTYKGMVMEISKEEFDYLQKGYISWADMFD